MTISRKMSGIALLVYVAAACGRVVHPLDEAQTIRDTEMRWNQEFMARDVQKLVDHYDEDAVLIAPGIAPSVGKSAIRTVLSGMLADPAMSMKFSAARIDVAASGDLAYSQGSYLMTMADPHTNRVIHDYGSYVTTYRRSPDGGWKAVTDIATSEARPLSAQPGP
jgi:ketosteroid isomerase-like protein